MPAKGSIDALALGSLSDDLRQLQRDGEPLEPPIRSAIFGLARFEQHGHSLAVSHQCVEGSRVGSFFPRLEDNVAVLRSARGVLERHIGEGLHLGPAAHWLLDNAALIDEQFERIHRGLPRSFFRQLPCLRDEPLAGLPRIYSIAWAWVAHTDSGLDAALLEGYLGAYQRTRELKIAELWALPSTLRVVLLENLRRLAERIALTQAARDAAHRWIELDDKQRSLTELESLDAELLDQGVAEAFRLQLQQREDELPVAIGHELAVWLARRLPNVPSALARQQQETTEDHQSIRNAITTLRGIGRLDWRRIFAATNPAMRTLAASPVHLAERDDSQAASLHAVERLAREAGVEESHVAATLVGLASGASAPDDPEAALSHGHQGPGVGPLRDALGLPRPRRPGAASAQWQRIATPSYLGGLVLLTLGSVAALIHGHGAPGASPWLTGLVALLMLGPASEAVVAVVNRLISESARPARLPRLSFESGIPPQHRTMVVIPAMLSNAAATAELAAQLEQHAIANNEPNVQFALLSDWADSTTEQAEGDQTLLDSAIDAITALNQRHPTAAGEPLRFLLLHRARRWSDSEQRWIGWERKRGKLEQLIHALAEPGHQPFIDLAALSAAAPQTRHLVTLDSDTDMPPGRLRALVGVAAHPVNRPRVDLQTRQIVAGYGILQPRVVTPLPAPETVTWFHSLFSGQCGIDPYSAASSEVYQDVFAEGTFTGKGLMNVEAMHALLGGRLPEGQVLSHDLLEGAIVRCATVTDVTLVEDAPVHADVANSRMHRWTRGDWQLLPFIFNGGRFGLSMLSRWKMIDNLRRSLVAPTSLLFLLLVMVTGVLPAGWAFAVVAAAFSSGPLLGAFAGLAPSRDDIALKLFYRHAVADLARALALAAWHLAQLLQLSMLYLNAIGLALYRQAVSRRSLLQWTTAAAAQAAARHDLPSLLRNHWMIPAVASLVAGVLLAAGHWLPLQLNLALPMLALWAASPLWTWFVSLPRPLPRRERLDDESRLWLQGLARDTWRYYEHHVGAQDNHLPPDNVQYSPHVMTAHRTSPTNIGMYLLATACAQALGFIGRVEMAARLAATLDTLERLPRHSGHFFNWYDTQTLGVLTPAYVSTVDSGNCSGHLLAVAGACDALASMPASLDTLQAALRLSAQRLLPLRPLLEASKGLGSVARLCLDPPPWPIDAGQLAEMQRLVQRSREELQALNLSLGADSEDGSMWLLHDHVAMVESALLDLAPQDADAGAGLRRLSLRCRALALAPDFAMLYDTERRLLHIGYRTETQELDDSHYDLLASEARLTSLLAIAKGDVPEAHWSALGRPFFAWGTEVGLKSWSGSMFEYLMPSLILDEPIGSVLHQITRSAVAAQIDEAQSRATPWGISESAIAGQDHTLAYQYGPQGIARLALRRTPVDERVIAPYASAMALMVAPVDAVANLRRLQGQGARRAMGFIEAIDYSPHRQVQGSDRIAVNTFMAHHQAMSLVAIADVLTDGRPRAWAMADPMFRAVSAMLHERVPREVSSLRDPPPLPAPRRQRSTTLVRDVQPLDEGLPATQLLTNGRHAVVLRSHGGGYSTWQGIGLTRWRDDLLRDELGSLFYLQRAGDPAWRSITARPAADPSASYRCRMQADRAVFDTAWPDLHARCTVWVSPEDDCEMRQIELCNEGRDAVQLRLASYAEITLAAMRADESHPAFSKLFVEARWDAEEQALYYRRQPRLGDEQPVFAVHFLAFTDGDAASVNACSDRARWLGRYGSTARPRGDGGIDLLPADAGSFEGPGVAVDTGLDPIASITVGLHIAAGATLRLTYCSAAGDDLEALLALVDKYRQTSHTVRASSMSHTMAGIRLRELQFDTDTWAAVLHLNTLLTAVATRELPPSSRTSGIEASRIDRRLLWRHSISGDRAIVLVAIRRDQGLGLVLTLKRALRLWTAAAVGVDLVVLNDEPASYLSPVQHQLTMLSERAAQQRGPDPAPTSSRMFVLLRSALSDDEMATLRTLARVRLDADGRSLAQQIDRLVADQTREQRLRAQSRRLPVTPLLPEALSSHDLATARAPTHAFDSSDGAVSFEVSDQCHPARPWVNVLANPNFGCQVSELGSGFSWAGNSRLHQITGWSNDPLGDPASEFMLLHDLDRNKVWPLGRSLGATGRQRVVHGVGYSRIEQHIDDLTVELTWSVDVELALRQIEITVSSNGYQPRRLRLVALAEWTLGGTRAERLSLDTSALRWTPPAAGAGLPSVRPVRVLQATQLDQLGGFGGATVFLAWRGAAGAGDQQSADASLEDWTCDRREFFDGAGHLVLPERLRCSQGAGLDACAAIGHRLDLQRATTASATLLLGHAASPAATQALLEKVWETEPQARLQAQLDRLNRLLGTIQVDAPDPAFNALVNHWLPYQTLVCRLWARAGFYQAGGAFGFRDQLQDAMSLVNHAPELLEQQILANAARQFAEGDVQHWWHAPGGAGVRTHFSDDLLWLPYACALYLQRTGDADLMEREVPFLVGSAVPEGAEDIYETPQPGEALATIYEHAARAIDRSLRVGAHGLPLFGTGDWNDGMNRVGHLGRGESVWLAWFACAVVEAMLPLAAARADTVRVTAWTAVRRGWVDALDKAGWDGEWYRRGYFDDGSPLGSAGNVEARIDLIAQAWAVLANAGQPERAQQAMASARRLLVDDGNALVRLLDPPLRDAQPSAGYIQAYPPGVRENGGQYNHAAVWAMMAWAQLGDGAAAWQVFKAVSPAHRWQDPALGPRYAIEPYVTAGDIYSQPPYVGRGGWSWYSGSAGWLSRAAIESICGITLAQSRLSVRPCLPAHWPEVSIAIRHRGRRHRLIICANEEVASRALAREPGATRLAIGELLLLDLAPDASVILVCAAGSAVSPQQTSAAKAGVPLRG